MSLDNVSARFAAITLARGVYLYDGKTEFDLTCLITATRDDDLITMMNLIELGFDVNFHIENFPLLETALHCAVRNNSLPAVMFLLALGADMRIPNANEGATPFCLAVLLGHIEIVRYMLEKGARADDVSSEQKTPPIVWGAVTNQHDCIQLLLQYKADINQRSSDNHSALYFAIDKGHAALADALVRWGATKEEE